MSTRLFPFIPAMLCFGPLLTVIGLLPGGPVAVAYAGTLLTSLGALCLFGMFNLLTREVALLKQGLKSEA